MKIDGLHGAVSFRPVGTHHEHWGIGTMEIDKNKIDDAVLALLFHSLGRDGRSWKSFDWGAMNRVHEKRFISNPFGKAKSVVLTDEGIERSEQLFRTLFCKPE
ncbi:hypothetical protein SAMN05892877_10499 [Rhizobium subbaraonis]|uniref:DUF6429 domain-containing protein n=2 Tax=Rhizobium subbaraonis TaxID=908946 RepID=A0A285U6I1_9HYPH|nr:hypothetical protein SAMN05892877_10499 [Rhizobium subbaraonis]